jgi:polyisoprenoid-binding protein YceI
MAASTAPTGTTGGRRSLIRRKWFLILVAVIVIGGVAGGGYGFWYLFLRPGGPAAVSGVPPVLPTNAAVAAPASLDGAWNVSGSLGSFTDFSNSWVGYRVKEQLAGIGANTAVGRSPKVTGSMTLTGTKITNVQITADLSGLVSDSPERDSQLKHQSLNTNQFPTATFTSIDPIDLGTLPSDGTTVTITTKGSLTLHGTTKPIDLTLEAVRQGGIIAVAGSMNVTYANFGFSGPTSFAVLSVEDHGIMELHLLFTHA